MANPFTSLKDFVDKPKRNTFDLSFQNNLTMKFGRLYPVFCKEVIPGDSFRIKPTFGLRFMPLVFPVQTRMQANLHFFYVRNRNLWKDWTDFIGRTKQNLVPPYLSPEVAKKLCVTGGLGDYFGIPTTLVGDYGSVEEYGATDLLYHVHDAELAYANWYLADNADTMGVSMPTILNWNQSETTKPMRGLISPAFDASKVREINGHRYMEFNYRAKFYSVPDSTRRLNYGLMMPVSIDGESTWRVLGRHAAPAESAVTTGIYLGYRGTSEPVEVDTRIPIYYASASGVTGVEVGFIDIKEILSTGINYKVCNAVMHLDMNQIYFHCAENYGEEVSYDTWNATLSSDTMISKLVEHFGNSDVRLMLYSGSNQIGFTDHQVGFFSPNFVGFYGMQFSYDFQKNRDISSVISSLNPYATGDIKISALPFRAYESIYNAFYRNQFNDPFILNGQKEFNHFITTDEGGEDSTLYDFFNRNWEMDFLTSAKQSPVDGDITPLVGVTSTGNFTFQNADGTTYTVTPVIGEDGNTLTGIDTVEGTPENNTGVRRLTDLISVGISINDFRNVNALQRWLETNLRRGYRYKDQLMSHFGVDAKFDVLDMPEFIGGMSEPVIVNQINQSVDQTGDPSGLGDFSKVLGSYAGQASVLAQSNHDVSKYCDEHGFIIGILSITPVPNYSQLLPKQFVKDSVLDFYFPEFGHVGNQPIPYREVCPLQSFAAGDPLTDVFGYQRAWYDYLASVDEVHGDFRTSLDGFLINRIFDTRPELGREFIQVDESEISNPFSVTEDGDKILGQVYFEVTAQRPIPKYGIPRLE